MTDESRGRDETDAGPVVRMEATLLRLPLFALGVKGAATLDGFEFRRKVRRGDRAIEAVVRTERDERAPYPGPLSRRVHMALLSLISDRGFPWEGPLTWTWRDLCRRMGLPASGRRDGELKAAIRASWGLKLYGIAASDSGRERETWRRLYAEVEFLNEPREDGTLAGANRLWLAPWYVESLNAFHAAPVDYALWRRLEAVGPLASRLYEYLVPSFYKREALELAYDRLAAAMPVVAEPRRSHAIRQFAPALEALASEAVIAGFAWDAMKGTGRPKLILDRGARLAPAAPAEGAAAKPSADREAAKRLAGEFYRLMGRPETQPLRSDLAIAGALIARLGAEGAAEVLPPAVRKLRARFRNAETMGALVRYVDEAEREARGRRDDDLRQAREKADRAAVAEALADDDALARRRWDALPDDEKARLRASVLADHPSWKRFPALVEAQCVARLEGDGA